MSVANLFPGDYWRALSKEQRLQWRVLERRNNPAFQGWLRKVQAGEAIAPPFTEVDNCVREIGEALESALQAAMADLLEGVSAAIQLRNDRQVPPEFEPEAADSEPEPVKPNHTVPAPMELTIDEAEMVLQAREAVGTEGTAERPITMEDIDQWAALDDARRAEVLQRMSELVAQAAK